MLNARDFELLLPWYLNGTLTDRERALVADYLRAHPEEDARVQWNASLRAGIKEQADELPQDLGLRRALFTVQDRLTPLLRKIRSADVPDSAIEAASEKLKEVLQVRLYGGGRGDMLDTAAWVSESCLELVQSVKLLPGERRSFFALTSRMMRNAMVDTVRERRAQRTGASAESLYPSISSSDAQVKLINEFLERLRADARRLAHLVETGLARQAPTLDRAEVEFASSVESGELVGRAWAKKVLRLAQLAETRQTLGGAAPDAAGATVEPSRVDQAKPMLAPSVKTHEAIAGQRPAHFFSMARAVIRRMWSVVAGLVDRFLPSGPRVGPTPRPVGGRGRVPSPAARGRWAAASSGSGSAATGSRRGTYDEFETHLGHLPVVPATRDELEKYSGRLPVEPSDLSGTEEAILKIHEALTELEQAEPGLAQLVEMRYFGGYSEAEIAAALEVDERTAQREWGRARLLLKTALQPS